MIRRHGANPLIVPKDVPPSRRDFEVVGAFNAGAAIVGKQTVLVLRVAERPPPGAGGTVCVPHLRFVGGKSRLSIARFSK